MINVVWWSGRGWDCCTMLEELFERGKCLHYLKEDQELRISFTDLVIVIHGGNEQLYGRGPATAEAINRAARYSDKVVFVVIGDETSEFPSHLLHHPNSRLWLQTPLPTQSADRYLIEGWTHDTKKFACPMLAKDIPVFFAGQDTHERRHACVDAVKEIEGSVLLTTRSFGAGLPHGDYFYFMSRARIVPCPAGPATPDSFRMAEALECGAIPIIDAVSLNPATRGFWGRVLPNSPLTIVDDWSTLPVIVDRTLGDWDRRSAEVQHWWSQYKREFFSWLHEDLKTRSGS